MTRWEEAHHPARGHVEALSLTRPPCRTADAAPQTSVQVASHLRAAVEALEAFAQRHQVPARHAAMTTVRKPLPARAALVDCWWPGVQQDVEPCLLSPMWRRGVHECVLPLVSWAHHAAHTRGARRQAKMRQALEAVHATLPTPTITTQLAPQVLEEWQAGAVQRTKALQRTSSAVAGRQGSGSHRHQNHRGLPRRRDKGWTIFHNFAGRAADGTTPASRFFRRTFPDLFATVCSPIEALPQPRRRKHQGALSH